MTSLKQCVKQILINKQHKAYEQKLSEKKVSYSDWIISQEEKIQIDDIIIQEKEKCLTNDPEKELNGGDKLKNEGFLSKNVVSCRSFQLFDRNVKKRKSNFLLLFLNDENAENMLEVCEICKNNKEDVILFALSEGEIAKITLPLIYKEFVQNENLILIYGDEDVKNGGKRKKPWFKPDWSPDTFLSYFYFGSLVAVKGEALRKTLESCDGNVDIYSLCRLLIEAGGRDRFGRPGCGTVRHIPEVLFHGRAEGYETVKDMKLPENRISEQSGIKLHDTRPLISVIIPSKDNPEVLFTCIHSFLEKTEDKYPYEILIIDNGSNEDNRKIIGQEVERLSLQIRPEGALCRITYHYQPMIFNFSRMCNLGASLANGELYLFLNDDMEIIQENWLTLLADKAVLPYAGAVGAKLLYPDSDIIQHAGITNLRVGPAHKLQLLSDTEVHYYGKNRFVHDVMAVTGACLLLRKEVFEEAGGFAEELAVAFNDVDLCYTIFEMGYSNIVRNDVALYHHESLSRGRDGESEEKQLRLLREKDVLYERHQQLYGKDPFYHKYLTTDMLESEYSPAFHYQVTLDMPWSDVTAWEKLPANVREDQCVVIGMECAMDIYKWKYGVSQDKGKMQPTPEDMGYYFQGYSFIIGADNACYKKTLLLQNKENMHVIKIPLDERYRADIRNNLKDQLNVDLTGFAAKVQIDSIPKGTYRFGMLAEDKCSRQKLVNYSSWILQK